MVVMVIAVVMVGSGGDGCGANGDHYGDDGDVK